ncbi:MAG: UbiH/UbiF family hydroxylase [Proteobacteria bacterium]|nr:UbiH/UbiF family hydroxylase [Pseudomonadota bacterium]
MRFDLVVVGGGAVGASVARAARGLSVALVAGARPAAARFAPDDFEGRVYALSPGSVEFLRAIRVWDAIPPDRLTPVHAMRVFGDDRAASMTFDAYDSGVAELAWIVEDRVLQEALWRALDAQDGLEIFAPARCEAIALGDSARITLDDGRMLEADLVVGADGAESFVRAAAGIAAREIPYGQTAVIANFACERPHGNTAFQWFQGGPILALLPLPGDRVSMVWSVAPERAAELMALDADALGRSVCEASKSKLGAITALCPPQAYPLRRITASRMVLPHLALAGDAAHVVHPLAGQGLNLGLQDAQSLGAILTGRPPVRGPGDYLLLRRYERERGEAILAMRAAVHGLHSLFGAAGPAARRLRNAGLNLTDRMPVLKNALLRHALR